MKRLFFVCLFLLSLVASGCETYVSPEAIVKDKITKETRMADIIFLRFTPPCDLDINGLNTSTIIHLVYLRNDIIALRDVYVDNAKEKIVIHIAKENNRYAIVQESEESVASIDLYLLSYEASWIAEWLSHDYHCSPISVVISGIK